MISGFVPRKKSAEDNGFHTIPAEAQSRYRHASELLHEGKTEDALHCFQQAIEIAPNYTEALHETGNCLEDLGRRDEARKYYTRALQEIGDRLCEIGRYEESLGRYWVAISRYEEAGKYYPGTDPEGGIADAPPQKKQDTKKVYPGDRKMQ